MTKSDDPVPARAIEAAILAALARARPGASICPSEAARALSADWRPLMGPVRAAAARLAAQGLLRVTQQGRPVDPETARGPVRLARAAPSDSQPTAQSRGSAATRATRGGRRP